MEAVAAKKEGIEAPAAEVAAASQPMKQKQKQTPKLKLKSTASPRSKRTAARLASDLVEPNPLGRRVKRVRKEVQSYDPTAEAARPQLKAAVPEAKSSAKEGATATRPRGRAPKGMMWDKFSGGGWIATDHV